MFLDRRPRLRSALAAVAAAGLLVAGGSLAADAAGKAKPLLAGANNKAKKTTKLSSKKGPALALKSKSGPALSVSNNSLIPNLNADLLDGKSLEQVAPGILTTSMFTANQVLTGTGTIVGSTTIPAGFYKATLSALFNVTSGESAVCEMIDYTVLLANPSDLSAVVLAGFEDDFSNAITDNSYVTIVAGHNYLFLCQATSGVEAARPAVFGLQKADAPGALPGVAPFTPKPGKNPLSGGAGLR